MKKLNKNKKFNKSNMKNPEKLIFFLNFRFHKKQNICAEPSCKFQGFSCKPMFI